MEALRTADKHLLDRLAITPDAVRDGCQVFERNEPRDSMYRVASYLLREGVWWGKPADMTDALTVLLLTWNSAFYRFGPFDAACLEACLREHWDTIDDFHRRDIASLNGRDRRSLTSLFLGVLEATKIVSGRSAGKRSPASAAKALHLLAPGFLPIWDSEIAKKYACYYAHQPADAYWRFCMNMQELAGRLKPYLSVSTKTLLKLIDEYNYATYTKGKLWASARSIPP